MKTFAVAIISILLSELCYGKINNIKQQALLISHQFESYSKGGSTRLKLSTNKAILSLMEDVESEDVERIRDGLNDSYGEIYFSNLIARQSAKIGQFLVGVEANNAMIAEVNNPVFPEVDLYNVRTNLFYGQTSFEFHDITLISKLTLMNRWYIEDRYSIEDLVEKVDLEIEGGKTFTPLFLDLGISYESSSEVLSSSILALDLLEKDRQRYTHTEVSYLKKIKDNFKVGLFASPYSEAEYSIEDSFGLFGKIDYRMFSFQSKISKLSQFAMIDFRCNAIGIDFGYRRILKSTDSNKAAENVELNLSLLY